MAARKGVALIVLLATTLACPPLLGANERQLKERELTALRERISALRKELASDRTRHSQLQTDLERIERKLGHLATAVRDLDGQVTDHKSQLAELKKRAQHLDSTLDAQRDFLARQVRAAYAMGRQEYVKILLNQEDPAAVGRVLTYYDYLNRARSQRINSILSTLKELDAVRTAMARETERLTALRGQEKTQLSRLEKSRADRSKLLARLQRQLSNKDVRLNRMLGNEKELEKLIAALSGALSDIPDHPGRSFAQLRGRLLWPTSGPRLANYGAVRASGKLHWQGVLIKAAEGQPVRAVSHGRVAFADWLRGYGLLIIIDHGNGYMSLYGHNQSLYKETGDWVEGGEVIASVGSSGGHERTALYFEIRHNGRPADPARWCHRG